MSLPPEVRARLVALARAAIRARLERRDAPETDPDGLAGHGVFVSLHDAGGDLRGCVGCLETDAPLEQTVVRMAVRSALEDPRFPPLSRPELDGLEVEVSVLGPLEPVGDPDEIEVGTHGVMVERGGARGVLLPQVATERGWDRETFLSQVCLKAGLARGAWRASDTRLRRFTADVFGDAA